MNTSSSGRRRAARLVLKALSFLITAGHAGAGLAQIELPLPHAGQAAPAAALLPPAVRAVPGARAWVLEAAEPRQGAAAAQADGARQAAAPRPDRFRTVSTAVGAWMIEDTEAPTPAAAAAGRAAVVRTVEIRTAEEFARAMANPQPMVVYRIVK